MGRVILHGAAIAILATAAHAQDAPTLEAPYVALYGGRLLTVDQDQAGSLTRGADLFALRLIVSAPGPYGLRLGFRGDVTSLGYIDPNSLDLSSIKTAEGYTALSWSTRVAGLDLGPAVMAGALVPVEGAVEWRLAWAYAGGARIGKGRSWAYAVAGKDEAADLACSCSPGLRGIVAGSIELWRISVQAEFISGPGGRKRVGALVRLPLPQWGQ
jgi:hypothetical protein